MRRTSSWTMFPLQSKPTSDKPLQGSSTDMNKQGKLLAQRNWTLTFWNPGASWFNKGMSRIEIRQVDSGLRVRHSDPSPESNVKRRRKEISPKTR